MSKSREEIRDELADAEAKGSLLDYMDRYQMAQRMFDDGLTTADAEHAAEMKECIDGGW